VKSEFEALNHELTITKHQRDEFERKLQQQLQEMQSMQTSLFELERAHAKFRQKHEEDLYLLKMNKRFSQDDSLPGPGPTSSLNGASSGSSASQLSVPISASSLNVNNSGGSNVSMMSGNISGLKRPRDDASQSSRASPSEPIESSVPSLLHATNPSKKLAIFKDDGVSSPDSTDDKKLSSVFSIGSQTTDKHGESDKDDRLDDWVVAYNPLLSTDLGTELMHTLEHPSVVCCVKFSHDGKYVATGCNKVAQIFDVESGEKVHAFQDDERQDGDLYIRSICFSPNGRFLATGAEDRTVKIWDIQKKAIANNFLGHQLDIYSLDFSCDGRYVVSGSGDRRAKIWDIEAGKCLFTLGSDEVGPKDGITSVVFSPDGRLVAAASLDRIIRVWDATTGFNLERFEGHMDSVYSVVFSPDGSSIASGSLDKTLRLWDRNGSRSRSRCRLTFNGHKDYVLSVAFSPTGDWLVSGSKDRSVQFWDPRSAVSHMILQGHKNSVISVAINPNNHSFATGSGDHRARVWKYVPNLPG